ncbi:MAG: SRPBCC family protein [Nocardioidaceae bacterium]
MTETDIMGAFRREGDNLAVRLERRYESDVDDLWSALTQPARLARWFADVTGDLRLGGEFLIVFDADDPSQRTSGSILECRPAERLAVSWRIEGEPTSMVTVDLAADGDGARLVLEEQWLPESQAAGYGAGWHAYLEQLAADLAGGQGHGPQWDERWKELLPAYQAQLAD